LVFIDREVIIDDCALPQSINKKPNGIVAKRGFLSGLENAFDDKGVLTNGT
jgi:hypothetical protein